MKINVDNQGNTQILIQNTVEEQKVALLTLSFLKQLYDEPEAKEVFDGFIRVLEFEVSSRERVN